MRWREGIQATKVAKTDTSPNQENPRGERLEQEGPRERSGSRRMKRRTGNPEPQTKPAEREPSTRQKTWTTGTRALSPLTETKTREADRNDPARRATGAGESKKNPR